MPNQTANNISDSKEDINSNLVNSPRNLIQNNNSLQHQEEDSSILDSNSIVTANNSSESDFPASVTAFEGPARHLQHHLWCNRPINDFDFSDRALLLLGGGIMKEKIGAMGVTTSKEPKRKIMNGSEHNNKQDRSPRGEGVYETCSRDGDPVREVCAKSQLEVSPKQFLKINRLKAYIERKPTTIDETSPGVLKYKTPHFRAQATVEVPSIGPGEHIQIGWIQACPHMQFINTYGKEGVTSWEFPEVVSGKFTMVCDADGRQYPWYGAKQELQTIEGPSDRQTLSVEMNDNFFPQVTWHVPDEKYDRKPRLTRIHRKQKFYTCLAVRDLISGKMYIYRTLTWTMELNVKVDPTQPLGRRAQVLEPIEQRQPKLLKHNITIPLYALKPPNANKSQTLIWRPRHGDSRIVVTPSLSTMDMKAYLKSTDHLTDKFNNMTSHSYSTSSPTHHES